MSPGSEMSVTFDVWITDGKGTDSNKLTGSVAFFLDDTGAEWLDVPMDAVHEFYGVAWSGKKFVAVGTGSVITSDDGLLWQKFSVASWTGTLLDVCWSGNQFVAVGKNQGVHTSPDGEHWTQRFVAPEVWAELHGVDGNGNQYVAVGYDYQNMRSLILTSADGVSWNKHSNYMTRTEIYAVASNGNRFVAVGQRYVDGENKAVVLTSVNAVDWEVNDLDGVGFFRDVLWTGSAFVASGFHTSASSNDGLAWQKLDNLLIDLNAITWSGRAFVGVGNGIWTSPNGLHWILRKPDDGLYAIRGVAWSGDRYVAVGEVMRVKVSPPL
jgi:hypothetical protein